ncbi:tetratricopeptide repeat protein [Teichococcus globiformis]
MKSIILFEDDHLRVVHQPRRISRGEDEVLRDVTLITFSDLTFRPEGTQIWGQEVARKLGVSAIGFVAKRENWFPPASVAAAASAVRQAVPGRAVTYGYSMGGYAALKHAATLGAEASFAVCPQSSISPAEAPWDSRFHRFHRAELNGTMAVRPGESGGFAVMLADPYMPEDRDHAARLSGQAGVHWLRTPFMDHASIWLLVEGDFLGRVMERVLAADLPGLTLMMRERRHNSPHWFRHAGIAAFRRNHVGMANRLWRHALTLGLHPMVLEQDIGRLLPQRVQELRALGRGEAARDLALAQAAAAPTDFTSQSHAGHALLGMAEVAAAEAPLRAALGLRQDVGHIYQGLSLVLGTLGRTDEAVALCRKGIAAAPADAGLRAHFGHLLLNAGQVQEGEAVFRATLEKDPADRQALLGLSHSLAARGEREEAIGIARQAIADGATDAAAFIWLGQLLLFIGDPVEAEPVFRDALAAAPEIGDGHVGLARALERTGRIEEARRVAAEAAAALPQHAKVQAIARRLGPPSVALVEADAGPPPSSLRRFLGAFFSRDQ